MEARPADTLASVTLGVVGAVKVRFAQSSHLGSFTGNIAITGESCNGKQIMRIFSN